MKIFRLMLLLVLILSTMISAEADETKPGRMTGVLARKDGRPLNYGLIYLFDHFSGPPPIIEKYWRIPDEIFEVDERGRFDIELIPGTYYIAYIKHSDPSDVGPPKKGELILISRDSKGQPVPYSLKAGEMLDIGKLSEAVPYDPVMVRPSDKEGITAIEGRILGKDGKPIAGVPVFAFMTAAAIGRPLFTSERTDKDGNFLLRVDKGGTYYLKVRGHYGGGKPDHDSVLDGEKDEQLAEVYVETGQIVKGVLNKALTQRGPKSKRKGKEYEQIKALKDAGAVIIDK